MRKANISLPPRALAEAADWLLRIQEAPLSDLEQSQFDLWHKTHSANQVAWQRAQRLLSNLETLPKDVSLSVLERPTDQSRRETIGKLTLLLAAGPMLWGSYKVVQSQQWTADYRTATGGFKEVKLADGSQIKLNTATAFDTHFDQTARVLTLREGEIEILTAKAHPEQFGPFYVKTQEGLLTPLGTRFIVRQKEHVTRLSVLEGSVRVMPKHSPQDKTDVIDAGQKIDFSAHKILSKYDVRPEDTAWLEHMLAVHDMPLKAFVAEVSRYRSGIIRVAPELESLPISGAFPTSNTDTILTMLAHTYPLKVSQNLAGYWTRIEPV